MIAVGHYVTVTSPSGTYKKKGATQEERHPSYVVLADPTLVVTVRPVNRWRDTAWVVLANGKAYPAEWCTAIDGVASEEGKE